MEPKNAPNKNLKSNPKNNQHNTSQTDQDQEKAENVNVFPYFTAQGCHNWFSAELSYIRYIREE